MFFISTFLRVVRTVCDKILNTFYAALNLTGRSQGDVPDCMPCTSDTYGGKEVAVVDGTADIIDVALAYLKAMGYTHSIYKTLKGSKIQMRSWCTRLNRQMDVHVMHSSIVSGTDCMMSYKKEWDILLGMRHPNVSMAHTIHVCNDLVFTVTDQINGRDLPTMVSSSGGRLGELRSLHIMRQVLSGLVHLHGLGISHRNISAENIVIDTDGTVQIKNFEAAHYCPPSTIEDSRYVCGSLPYLAPEMLRGDGTYIPHLVDMWAVGILFFWMLSGGYPLLVRNKDEASRIFRMADNHVIFSRENLGCTSDCRDFSKQLLERNWANRLVAADALEICDELISRY